MKLNIPLPFDKAEKPDEFCTMEAVRRVGACVEQAGFDAGLVTDHPVPTVRWLESGGHYAQSPFVMLGLLAAHTTRLRLQTGILVLPYRNPFIVARDVTTLDAFSGGRVTLSVGAGYLKGEYRALGVDFDRRNELMDEYIRALRAATRGDNFDFEGTGYTAFESRIVPGSPQDPLPILVGGNSRRAIRRAAELADGWNPFFTVGGEGHSNTTRTALMTGPEHLTEAIAYMADHAAKIGRETLPKVVLGSLTRPGEVLSAQQLVDRVSEFARLGIDGAGIFVDGESLDEWCENVGRIGEDVIAKLDR